MVQGESVKRISACILMAALGVAVSFPAAARADQDAARRTAQRNNLKQSHKDLKRGRSEQKKMLKAGKKAAKAQKAHQS